MKSSLVVAGISLLGVGVALNARQTATQGTATEQLWEVGECYRVFPANRDQLYIFKVLEPPRGAWIRVQSDPSNPPVPGARPQVPLWLNQSSAFAVQQWPCSG
jgi:hypothetical protein